MKLLVYLIYFFESSSFLSASPSAIKIASDGLAEKVVGNNDAAKKILEEISAQIINDGAVYEVYDLEQDKFLKPVKRLIYKAEKPFTWSSGLYLEAAL